jgi:hypothetical protein
MKLKLLAIAAAVSASSLSFLAHAEARNPQPSFDDFAKPVGESRGAPAIQRDLPKPSFADNATVVEERVVTAADEKPVADVLAAFPQPSSIAN